MYYITSILTLYPSQAYLLNGEGLRKFIPGNLGGGPTVLPAAGRTVGSIPIGWSDNSITGLPPITRGCALDDGGTFVVAVGSKGEEEGCSGRKGVCDGSNGGWEGREGICDGEIAELRDTGGINGGAFVGGEEIVDWGRGAGKLGGGAGERDGETDDRGVERGDWNLDEGAGGKEEEESTSLF